MRSNFVFQEIWVGLRRNLTMTVALIVVVAISLSLLGTGLLFVKQVDSTRTFWQSKVEISVYLCTDASANPSCHGAVTASQQAQLQQTLASMPQVQHVTYVSQEMAYSLFKQDFAKSYHLTLGDLSSDAWSLMPGAANFVADEPTGNIDPATSIGIMKVLDRINRTGTTVVMATHDAAIVDSMRKRVIELEYGKVVRDQVRGVYGQAY